MARLPAPGAGFGLGSCGALTNPANRTDADAKKNRLISTLTWMTGIVGAAPSIW